MKRITCLELLLATIWSACQHTQDITPTQASEQSLTEIGPNQLPLLFNSVQLTARSSVSSLTITSQIQIDDAHLRVLEYGFCLSQIDSLPRITSAGHKRIKAALNKVEPGVASFSLVIADLLVGQTYYIDPYVILTDGRILYGRYNQPNRASATRFTAISFQLPKRPVLQTIQLIPRASVPTPLGASGTSPIPSFHHFFTLKGRLYSFYPTGALNGYDATADRWVPMANLGQTLFGPHSKYLVFPVGDKLYAYLGLYDPTGAAAPSSSMWEYDPTKNQWTNLGQSFGDKLLYSRYQLSTDGKAYFNSSDPYGILVFDAQQKRIDLVAKPNLLANLGSSRPYILIDKDTYYNSAWAPGGSVSIPGSIRTRLVEYNLSSDQVAEATALSNLLSQQHYNNTDGFLIAQGTDLLTGFGTVYSPIIHAGSVEADGLFFKDELVRYSLQEQRITGYYDLSGLPNSQSFSQRPLLVNNRLFIFNGSTDQGLLTEVIFK